MSNTKIIFITIALYLAIFIPAATGFVYWNTLQTHRDRMSYLEHDKPHDPLVAITEAEKRQSARIRRVQIANIGLGVWCWFVVGVVSGGKGGSMVFEKNLDQSDYLIYYLAAVEMGCSGGSLSFDSLGCML